MKPTDEAYKLAKEIVRMYEEKPKKYDPTYPGRDFRQRSVDIYRDGKYKGTMFYNADAIFTEESYEDAINQCFPDKE